MRIKGQKWELTPKGAFYLFTFMVGAGIIGFNLLWLWLEMKGIIPNRDLPAWAILK